MLKTVPLIKTTQVSLTGARTIFLIGLLLEGPKSFDEINDFFTSHDILIKRYSKDTIRMDINCLRSFGFKITKATPKTDGKFVLLYSPIGLNTTSKEITALKKLYALKSSGLSIDDLLNYETLFNKISELTLSDEHKEMLKGISRFKGLDKNLINEINLDCKKKNQITILYESPSSGEREITIQTDKLDFRSDKLYLFGSNTETGKSIFLKFSRIKKVLVRFLVNKSTENKTYDIKFSLKNYSNYDLSDNEKVLEKSDDTAIISGQYFNDFTAKQRILFFANDCTVIEPQDFIDELIQELERMKNLYV